MNTHGVDQPGSAGQRPGRGGLQLPISDRQRLTLRKAGLVAAVAAIIFAVAVIVVLGHLGWFVVALGIAAIVVAGIAVLVITRELWLSSRRRS